MDILGYVNTARIKSLVVGVLLLFFCIHLFAQSTGFDVEYNLTEDRYVSIGIYAEDGQMVRELLSAARRGTGHHVEHWDGLDGTGVPVASGRYTWKLLATPGLKSEYLMTVGTNYPYGPKYKEVAPGSHLGPHAVYADGSEVMIAAGVTENIETMMIKMPYDGQTRTWTAYHPEAWQGGHSLTMLDGTLYMLSQNDKIWPYTPATGNKGSKIEISWDGVEAGTMDYEDFRAQDMGGGNGLLAVVYTVYDAVRWYDPITKAKTREVTGVPSPKAVAMDESGNTYVASGSSILKFTPTATSGSVLISGLDEPSVLTFDPDDQTLLVGEHGQTHQIKRYNLQGGLQDTYGDLGGRQFGLYNAAEKERFYKITDIAPDGQGGFFITEPHTAPVRTAHFNAQGQLINEWYGGTSWGKNFQFDPEDPTIVYYQAKEGYLVRALLDYSTNEWTIHSVMPFDGLADRLFKGVGGDRSVFVRKYAGRTYIIADRLYQMMEVNENSWSLDPVFSLGRIVDLPDDLKTFTGYRFGSYVWRDQNHDGNATANEFDFYNDNAFSGNVFIPKSDDAFNMYWYLPANETFYRLTFAGFDQNNMPIFPDEPRGSYLTTIPDFVSQDGLDVRWAFTTVVDTASQVAYIGVNEDRSGWGVFEDSYLMRVNTQGEVEWRVGQRGHGPGKIDVGFRFPLKVAHGCAMFTAFDSRRKTFVWDSTGLWVGNLVESPDYSKTQYPHLYEMSSDPKQGDIYTDPHTGDVLFMAGWENEARLYRITGWNNWIRDNGTFTLSKTSGPVGLGLWQTIKETEAAPLVAKAALEATVDENWGNTLPTGADLPPGAAFVANWNGFLDVSESGFYQFRLTGIGTAGVSLDGRNIVRFDSEGQQIQAETIFLEGGKRYPLFVRLGKQGNKAKLMLEWKAEHEERFSVIPQYLLYPSAQTELMVPGTGTGLLMHLYEDQNLTRYIGAVKADTQLIHFGGPIGHRDPLVKGTEVQAMAMRGKIQPRQTGHYSFFEEYKLADLQIRVNDTLVLKKGEHALDPVYLVAGEMYDIEIVYTHDNKHPSTAHQIAPQWYRPDEILEAIPTSQLYSYAYFEPSVNAAAVGERIYFDATGSVGMSGKPVSWEWDFGDGSTRAGNWISHLYQHPGTYKVRLTVTDHEGQPAEFIHEIHVGAGTVQLPVQDAFVKSSESGQNFNTLYLEVAPAGNSALLQFDLSQAPELGSYDKVLLQLFPAEQVHALATDIGVRRVTAAWSEETLTADQMPTPSGSQIGLFDAFEGGNMHVLPIELDKAEILAAGNNISLALEAVNNNGSEAIRVFSGESQYAPRLMFVSNYTGPVKYVPQALIDQDSFNLDLPVVMLFNGTQSSDQDGTIVQYQWVLNDSVVSTQETYLFSQEDPGDFNLKLIVTDNEGFVGVDSVEMDITTAEDIFPIELLDFDAQQDRNERRILLTWETASEDGFDRFVLERSQDGTIFSGIGEVEGRGNRNEGASYQYGDEKLPKAAGIFYYRLRLLDIDGSFEYSDIKAVNLEEGYGIELSIGPVPVSVGEVMEARIQVELEKTYRIGLTNPLGQIIWEDRLPAKNETIVREIATNGLKPGIYLVYVQDVNDPKATTSKMVQIFP
ncbi:MAG: PKD domain-containing protein [Bacteroidota bacterium]